MERAKNKTMTYLLICAVATVWGIIVYRIFFNQSDQDVAVIFAKSPTTHEPYNKYEAENDTIPLTLNYRDPFLGSVVAAVKTDTSAMPKISIPAISKTAAPEPNWQTIRYNGYIINPVTKKMVAILNVNGLERMTAVGESFQGVTLLKNKKDSVLVGWMGKRKYIRQ